MGRSWTGAVLAALMAGGAMAAEPPLALAGKPPPLEAYGKLPSLEQVVISPDGRRLAYVSRDGDVRMLVIQNIASGKAETAMTVGAVKLRGLDWAGPGHLLITSSVATHVMDLSGPMREYPMVNVYDLARRRMRPLMPETERALNAVLSVPQVVRGAGDPVVFFEALSFPQERGVVTLYRADLKSGTVKQLEVGQSTTRGFVVDAHGALLARSDYEERAGRLTVSLHGRDGWTPRYREVSPIDYSDLEGLGRDGRSVVLASAPGDGDADAYVLREMAADGTLSTELPLRFTSLVRDPATSALLGGRKLGDTHSEYVFFNPADQKAWDLVARAFKGEEVELQSWSDDRRQLVVHVFGAEHGDAFYHVDLATGHADWFGDQYADIAPDQVAEVRWIHYAAKDGMDIPAYLTLPRRRIAKNLPLIVLPHGGPAARDTPEFDWFSQALASRGYAVLQPQFRGSSGLGAKRLTAGYGEWGRKMQTDLSDGVRALAAQGLIDPKRVCIAGASYGGYAALAGATLDAGAYRCAASLSGPADLRRFLRFQADKHMGVQNATLRYWDRFLGVTRPDDVKLDAISPARLADKVSIPVLLMHGRDDTVVPFEQSLMMQKALQKAGKPVELVALKGEDHWLSRSETRLQMLKALTAFLHVHNPPE